MRIHHLAVPVALSLVLVAFIQAEEKDNAELKKLDGTWKLDSLQQVGVVTTRSPLFDASWTLEDGKVDFKDAKGTVRKHKITVDASKSPKTIDFVYGEGDNKGKKSLGIYKLEGNDRLVLCLAPPGKERPTKFEVKPGENVEVQVLVRQKK